MQPQLPPENERLDIVFDIVVEAAIKGERCPTKEQLRTEFTKRGMYTERASHRIVHMPINPLVRLARQGRLWVAIYPCNYRVVEIREGPHKGKRTKAPPNPDWKPYKEYPADVQPPE